MAKAILKMHETRAGEEMGRAPKGLIESYDWREVAKKAVKEYHAITSSREG